MKSLTVKIVCICFCIYQCTPGVYAQGTKKEEFTLQSKDGIQLAGQIEYPDKPGKFPAAILIWGSGPHTRDQVVSGSPMFSQISAFLCKQGMAVLRMDKRGFGKSSAGSFKAEGKYTTRDLANDIKIAYSFLNKKDFIDSTKVGLIGHSEGSTIAAMLAAEEPGLDWVIVFGPQAVAGDSIIAEQTRLNRKNLGISPEVSAAIGKVWEKYFRFIKEDNKNDSVYYGIGREFLIAHGLDKDDKQITNTFIDQLLDGYKNPWNRYFITTDPAQFFQQIQIPLLAVFGADDAATSVKQNLVPMNNALNKAGNKNYRIMVLADEDHFFLRYQDKQMPKHKFGEMQVSERLQAVFTEWLKAQGIL
jgi:uncharacterized protein